MGKKNRSKKIADPGNAAGFDINPFANLSSESLGIEKEPKAPPAAKPKKKVAAEDGLSPADQQLLNDLGDASLTFKEPEFVKGTVSLQIQRKGRGGKTVTRLLGLKQLTVEEEMALLGQLKRDLGTGAVCREGVIELQGDLRDRCRIWLKKNHYRVKN